MRGVSLTMRETTALSSRLTISPYKRYVDDIYVQTTNEETADHFHHIINKVHPNLKFEIEKQKQHRVACHYRFQSHHIQGWQQFFWILQKASQGTSICPPSITYSHKIQTQLHSQRTKTHRDRCSSHLNTFDDILGLNGYPENSTEQTKRPQNPQRNPQPANTEWSYLKIPYISTRLNHRIANIFRKENIPVRNAHKSYTLRRALSLTSMERKCTRDKCPISNTGLC